MSVRFEQVSLGDTIPEATKGPVDRGQLASFAAASGDHNPIHLDDQEAKKGGLPGVIVHGMLQMAFLAQMLTDWAPQSTLRSFSTRFVSIAFPGDTITCRGVVKSKEEKNGEKLVNLELSAVNQHGQQTLTGVACLALP